MWANFVYGLSKVVALLFSWVYFRFRRVGRAHVPLDGPVLFVANHGSFLDPMLVGTASPRRVYFIARRGLGKVPLLAWWMRTIGVVLVDRNSGLKESMERAIGLLSEGKAVCLFPEGTRSPTGEVLPFQRGTLLLLKKSRATVVPVGVRGSFSAFPRGKSLPRPKRCAIHFGAPVPAEEILADGGLAELRRQIAELSDSPLREN